MTSPQICADLQNFLCDMQWIRSDIPEFSSIIGCLAELLEKLYTIVGKRTPWLQN